ncbi:NAD(P)/FAD-dependent oxidoreductase [Cohnella sp. AR92]|uniref:NAD(P)/FAD-dependent oxidoreductase n=1 Tax=Cohnella sp. AR92 TaxID=648716 RepID=UPI0013157D71|nr:NAD(P)/FAD-dependent oxidoreductase [Cohnella sp. AR92]
MNKQGLFDVIVLGAGIAGSSLAYALARRGWSVLLLDRRTGPVHKACGEFLSPEARSSLRSLELEDTVDRLGAAPIHRVQLHSARPSMLEFNLKAPSFGISRRLLDEALRQAAVEAGAAWMGGTAALSVELEKDRYRVRVRLGHQEEAWLQARTVFGAWGRNGSAALKGNRISRKKQAFRGVGWKIHSNGMENRQAVELYCFKGGYIGLSPIGGGLMNAAALVEQSVAREAPRGPLGWLKLAAEGNPAFASRFEGAEPILETEQAAAPIRTSEQAVAWREYPLLGDAALVIPPLCGDGMAMALRSAERSVPLADAYLRGEIGLEQWKKAYRRLVSKEMARPARWGRWLQAGLIRPTAAGMLIQLGSASPRLAQAAFRATRLAMPPVPT